MNRPDQSTDSTEKHGIKPKGQQMSNYRGWPLLDKMPAGWVFCKAAGSPLHRYEFITNGKSPLNGQQRALLKISPTKEKRA